ncbi:MAG: N-acetyltransferase [Sphingobium sp.]
MPSAFPIRLEQPTDAAAISAVTRAAFQGHPHSDRTEAAIVEALRAADALTLSLVAVNGAGEIAGHIAFSPITVDGAAGRWFGLGPLSVLPAAQKQGIGQALVRDGLRRLKADGAGGCVLLGSPRYYARFGFVVSQALRYPGGPADHFQHLLLDGAVPRGKVGYHPGFDAR